MKHFDRGRMRFMDCRGCPVAMDNKVESSPRDVGNRRIYVIPYLIHAA
jgi:hypothetical protein